MPIATFRLSAGAGFLASAALPTSAFFFATFLRSASSARDKCRDGQIFFREGLFNLRQSPFDLRLIQNKDLALLSDPIFFN